MQLTPQKKTNSQSIKKLQEKTPQIEFFTVEEEHPGFQGITAEVLCKDRATAKELLRRAFGGKCPPDSNIKDRTDCIKLWPHVRSFKVDEVRLADEAIKWIERCARHRKIARQNQGI